LYADRLVNLSGLKADFKIVPFRGEYYQLSTAYNNYFNYLIYPVPDPNLPFLGVHFTPQMMGFATVGPNAVLAFAREGYRWRDINIKDFCEIISFPPVWKMVSKHFKAICAEIYGSLSKRHYLSIIHRYFPDIKLEDLKQYPAGVRAQAMSCQGNLIEDFLFMESDRILHTCNAPSPAATSSLPIGQYIVNKFFEKLG
jgi:(S)-2-hydroxyglutarate dehydrogenase